MSPAGLTPTRQAFTNACDTPLNEGGASNVMNAETLLYGQLEPLTFKISQQYQDPVSFLITETFRSVATQGSVQPLEVRELSIKPEGQRRWTWLKIFALPDLVLRPGDLITVTGTKLMPAGQPFRIMGSKPWAQKGWMYYETVAAYQIPPGYVYE